MADIRIKDLATTASSAASDDFMALDGATNGTRKMSAANPSVTTLTTSGVIAPGGSVHGANGTAANPSFAFASNQNTGLYRIGVDNIGVAANGAKVLDIATTGLTVTGALGASSLTSPAATPLTLGLGTGGTALTLESSTLAATFAGSIKGSAAANYFGGTTAPAVPVAVVTQSPGGNLFPGLGITSAGGSATKYWNLFAANVYTDSDLFFVPNSTALASAVLRISNGGVVTLSNSTAGSSGAGALVVTGGLSAGNNGNASYFGGNVTLSGTDKSILLNGATTAFSRALDVRTAGDTEGRLLLRGGGSLLFGDGAGTFDSAIARTSASVLTVTGGLTTTGAVTVGGALKLGNAYVGTVIAPTGYVTIQDSNGNTYKIAVSA